MAKFHFITTLLPKQTNKGNWQKSATTTGRSVEESLIRMLDSIRNQTCLSECMVHISGHNFPTVEYDQAFLDKHVRFHTVSHPLPTEITLAQVNELLGSPYDAAKFAVWKWKRRIDKSIKRINSLNQAMKDPDIRFVYVYDFDDLFHKTVVEYSLENENNTGGGFHTEQGYAYRVGANHFKTMEHLSHFCGSVNCVKISDEERDTFAKTGSVRFMHTGKYEKTGWLLTAHGSTWGFLDNLGRKTHIFPFRAAVYVVNTGSNVSGTKRSGRVVVPLTRELGSQYGLTSWPIFE